MANSRPTPSRSRASISSLEKSLAAYALAGAGAVALTPALNAQIIYTPANITFYRDSVVMDLNHDGITDFSVKNREFSYYGFYSATLGALGHKNPGAAIVGQTSASALQSGEVIGSSRQFISVSHKPSAQMLGIHCTRTCQVSGPWQNEAKKFLGLRVVINGETHYGWARLSAKLIHGHGDLIRATLSGYAYESTPNKPIVAGDRGFAALEAPIRDTPSKGKGTSDFLGLLSAGYPALSLWRPSTK